MRRGGGVAWSGAAGVWSGGGVVWSGGGVVWRGEGVVSGEDLSARRTRSSRGEGLRWGLKSFVQEKGQMWRSHECWNEDA
ncbi:MAG TPA: hypothetical protein VGK24_09255 [Candidatus Angelobacter sp.]